MSTAFAGPWRGVRSTRLRWGICGAIIVGLHVAVGRVVLHWMAPPAAVPPQPVVMIDLPPPQLPARQALHRPQPPRRLPSHAVPPRIETQRTLPPRVISQPLVARAPVAHAAVMLRSAAPSHTTTRDTRAAAPTSVESQAKPAVLSAADAAPAATQSVATPEPIAVKPSAPVATTASARSGLANWQGVLLGRLARYKRYPAAAQSRHQEGVTVLRFTMDRRGHVLAASIDASSGVDALDAETLALIHRAEPLPSPPPSVPGETIELVVPVQFSLR
jgi:protein TonB